MKHRLILASTSILALAAALVPGCGDSEDAPTGAAGSGSPGAAGAGSQVASAGTGGAAPGAAGGGSATPGTGGSEGAPVVQPPMGSAGSTGANLGAGQGGSGGAPGAAGAGGAPAAGDPSALCPVATPSPADGVACSVTCTDPCGIHNLGTRLCTCASAVFDCASCAYGMPHPLLATPDAPLSACTLSDDAQEDATGCTENQRCQSIGRTPGATDGTNRFCGCLAGKWDCDTKPMGF